MLYIIGNLIFFTSHDNGKELTVLTVYCHLTVRCTAVKIDNISGIKKLYSVTELMLHDTLCDDGYLMSVVIMQCHGLIHYVRIKGKSAEEKYQPDVIA